MKYWNKDKRIRQAHWFKIECNWNLSYFERKRQLQQLPSTGKFYLYFGSNTIWFEREQDAMWFTLSRK